jgi:hypothetical protein
MWFRWGIAVYANWNRIMQSLKLSERRQSLRRHLFHIVKIQISADTAPRECLIQDISDDGVRIYVVGFDVPDEFVLILSGDDIVQERYKVIWRIDREIGAKFVRREPPRLSLAS